MPVQISDYVNVEEQANRLGCNIPTGLALLPHNFADAKTKEDLVHESSTSTVRVLWDQTKIPETNIEKQGEKFPQVMEEAFEWIGPVIFVGYGLYIQNPRLISTALEVISNYLTVWFKGIPRSQRHVKLDVVVETPKRTYKRVHYEGSKEGLKELPRIIRQVNQHE